MTAAAIATPLSGITVVVTRPRDSALSRVLRRAGARVIWQPAICIGQDIPTPALDAALRQPNGFEWIVFTSAHGVSAFWRRARALNIARETIGSRKFAAVGPATARAIVLNGARVEVTAEPHSAEGLIVQLAYRLDAESTVLYPRASGARPILADGLRKLGAQVTEVVAYETRPASTTELPAIFDAGVDCVVFCSPSAVRAVLPHHALVARTAIACIGPTTADAVREAGWRAEIVAPRATAAALATAVIEHFHGDAVAAVRIAGCEQRAP